VLCADAIHVGVIDDVVPLDSSTRFAEALARAGANVTYVTLPNGEAATEV
jgi:dipeptidyl aminopeptidase/acylaminoacyl peptidase